jgi:hypothetical protein
MILCTFMWGNYINQTSLQNVGLSTQVPAHAWHNASLLWLWPRDFKEQHAKHHLLMVAALTNSFWNPIIHAEVKTLKSLKHYNNFVLDSQFMSDLHFLLLISLLSLVFSITCILLGSVYRLGPWNFKQLFFNCCTITN